MTEQQAILRKKWQRYKEDGTMSHLTTDDLIAMKTVLDTAIESLLIFDDCNSTRTWCCYERDALDSVIRARQSKSH